MKVDLADIEGDLPGAPELLGLMAQDKKVTDGKLRFILAKEIGQAFIADDVPHEIVLELLTGALTSRR